MSKAGKVTRDHNPNSKFGNDEKAPETPAEQDVHKKRTQVNNNANNNEESNEEPKKEPKETTNEVTNEDTNIEDIVLKFHKAQTEKELKQDIAGNYTLVVRHELMERLDVLAEHHKRGFKSDLVNEALETFISIYEKQPLPPKRKKRGRR